MEEDTVYRVKSNKLLIGVFTEHILCTDMIQGEEHPEWVFGDPCP